jgi:hypothetical protein
MQWLHGPENVRLTSCSDAAQNVCVKKRNSRSTLDIELCATTVSML